MWGIIRCCAASPFRFLPYLVFGIVLAVLLRASLPYVSEYESEGHGASRTVQSYSVQHGVCYSTDYGSCTYIQYLERDKHYHCHDIIIAFRARSTGSSTYIYGVHTHNFVCQPRPNPFFALLLSVDAAGVIFGR